MIISSLSDVRKKSGNKRCKHVMKFPGVLFAIFVFSRQLCIAKLLCKSAGNFISRAMLFHKICKNNSTINIRNSGRIMSFIVKSSNCGSEYQLRFQISHGILVGLGNLDAFLAIIVV
jgi:hypothetical protein